MIDKGQNVYYNKTHYNELSNELKQLPGIPIYDCNSRLIDNSVSIYYINFIIQK